MVEITVPLNAEFFNALFDVCIAAASWVLLCGWARFRSNCMGAEIRTGVGVPIERLNEWSFLTELRYMKRSWRSALVGVGVLICHMAIHALFDVSIDYQSVQIGCKDVNVSTFHAQSGSEEERELTRTILEAFGAIRTPFEPGKGSSFSIDGNATGLDDEETRELTLVALAREAFASDVYNGVSEAVERPPVSQIHSVVGGPPGQFAVFNMMGVVGGAPLGTLYGGLTKTQEQVERHILLADTFAETVQFELPKYLINGRDKKDLPSFSIWDVSTFPPYHFPSTPVLDFQILLHENPGTVEDLETYQYSWIESSPSVLSLGPLGSQISKQLYLKADYDLSIEAGLLIHNHTLEDLMKKGLLDHNLNHSDQFPNYQYQQKVDNKFRQENPSPGFHTLIYLGYMTCNITQPEEPCILEGWSDSSKCCPSVAVTLSGAFFYDENSDGEFLMTPYLLERASYWTGDIEDYSPQSLHLSISSMLATMALGVSDRTIGCEPVFGVRPILGDAWVALFAALNLLILVGWLLSVSVLRKKRLPVPRTVWEGYQVGRADAGQPLSGWKSGDEFLPSTGYQFGVLDCPENAYHIGITDSDVIPLKANDTNTASLHAVAAKGTATSFKPMKQGQCQSDVPDPAGKVDVAKGTSFRPMEQGQCQSDVPDPAGKVDVAKGTSFKPKDQVQSDIPDPLAAGKEEEEEEGETK